MADRRPDLSKRPPYVHDRNRDPRRYDLAPRPTVNAFPEGWTEEGQRRHRMSTLFTLTFLAGYGLGADDRREERIAFGLRLQALQEELLNDPAHGRADTAELPRQRTGS